MDYTLIYYHRIPFPSVSGETIQVLRNYYAMSGKAGVVHILYRASFSLNDIQINDSLETYGAELSPFFRLHYVGDRRFGRYRTKRKVIRLTKLSEKTVIIVTRTLDHARDAISIRDKFSSGRTVKVILELHETAIPHIVYREQGRNIKAFFSLRREKKIFHNVDGILCTALPQLTILDQIFQDHAPAVVLPNQYNPAFQYMPRKFRKPGKDIFHIRYASPFSTWKNDIMFQTLMFLPENIVLDIAGGDIENKEGTEKMLMERSRKYGVEGRVNYMGFLPPTQTLSFLSDADCLLLPLGNDVQSRLFISPVMLFEYAAIGVPMVVTRQPTTLSLIKEGTHALMADPNSPEAFAEAVKFLSANSKFARKLAENAKKWVAQYAPDNRVKKYKSFLLSVVGDPLSTDGVVRSNGQPADNDK